MSVFTTFEPRPYTFLRLDTNVHGKTIAQEYQATGIIKLRDNQSGTDVKTRTSNSTVHIKPNEPFVADLNGLLVGHGINVSQNPKTPEMYEIIAQSYGYNYQTNEVEHIRVELQKLEIATWQASELPVI